LFPRGKCRLNDSDIAREGLQDVWIVFERGRMRLLAQIMKT